MQLSTDLTRIWDKAVVVSQARQLGFMSLVASAGFNIDLPKAMLRFANGLRYRVQCLGSEAGGSWLWAWANPSLQEHGDAISVAGRLHQLGIDKNIPAFNTGEFPLSDRCSGHSLTTIAQYIAKAPLHYSCPTDGGGRAWFLVYGLDDSSRLPVLDAELVNRSFASLMPQVAFNHWTALSQASQEVGGPAAANGILNLGTVDYQFDEHGRVTQYQQRATSGTSADSSAQYSSVDDTEPSMPLLPEDQQTVPETSAAASNAKAERPARRRVRSRRRRR